MPSNWAKALRPSVVFHKITNGFRTESCGYRMTRQLDFLEKESVRLGISLPEVVRQFR
jgi:hypothetical protein